MASGKSLELSQIKPQRSPKCTCGVAYTDHMRRDGKGLLAKYNDGTHNPMTAHVNRAMRRSHA